MEPLYTTETAYTFEEYKRFYNALVGKKITALSVLVILTLLLFSFATSNFAGFLLSVILFGILFPIIINKMVKQNYYSDKQLQKNYMCQFSFYQYYFEVKTNSGYVKFDYEDIHSIKETKTHFYIMKSVNQAYLIVKANCSPELIEFLSNMKK